VFPAIERLGYRCSLNSLDEQARELGADPDGSALFLCDIGIVRASLVRQENLILCEAAERASAEDVQHCLLDLVLPKLLAVRGDVILHGSCVAPRVGTGGVCFLGLSGHGKSTLAASFRQHGWRLVADDSSQLSLDDGSVIAHGLCANPRLLPDSLTQLFPDPVTSAPVVSYRDKRRVALDPPPPAGASLAAIFELAAPNPAVTAPRITRMTQAEACMTVVSHCFSFDPDDRREGAARFRNASRIVNMVPVFKLAHPRDYVRLSEVQDAILTTLDELQKDHAAL
jgi:hypothetical protein